ncbi:pirin family protein [Candidatus Albibeggiatoa sp. nov. NOAA]|uniref:pirin family protein n=1 Tax=Candidatus Albibeggiatoa sp. nov. NOAA TaxID=3162724 RepID=UPI0032F51A19|nr:pirin family protein [Thiotrichaceae bacterium]
MLFIRRNYERGHTQNSWLNSHHTFSFGEYYDPKFMGVSHLKVINDDIVEAGMGFPTHSHQNMEIISYVLEGALEHKDSMGNVSTIHEGEVQCMSAGTGITHSEYNPSQTKLARFLQVWITPNKKQLMPNYQQKMYTCEQKQGCLCLIASPDGQDGSMLIHQNAKLLNALIDEGESVSYSIDTRRLVYAHIATGQIQINNIVLSEGDGATIRDESQITLMAEQQSEVLLFDLQDKH